MKKVLILTYYWPPAGGPGVQRILKFAKYLPDFGWLPIILTVKSGEYPQHDESLIQEIPSECKVYQTFSFEPFLLYKILTGKDISQNIPTFVLNPSTNDRCIERMAKWVRANIFVPDAKIGWIPFAVKNGLKIIEHDKIDLIFSSSPPHSLQLSAQKISKLSRIKWVADFRDPWHEAFWVRESKKIDWINKYDLYLEKTVLQTAHAIICPSPSIQKLFESKAKNNYTLITNGYDHQDYLNLSKIPSVKMRITYIGHLGKDQNISNFLMALKNLDQNIITNIEVNFYGHFHSAILKAISDLHLEPIINLHGYLPHGEIIKKIINSELLLLVIPQTLHNDGIITGKIFEYLASQNFILGIGPKGGDAARILANTKCGAMVDYNDDITHILISKYNEWINQAHREIDQNVIERYSRINLTKKLADVFNSV